MSRSGVYTRSSPAGNSGFTVVTVLNQGIWEYFLKLPSGGQIGPVSYPDANKISVRLPDSGKTAFLTIDSKVFPLANSSDIKAARNTPSATLAKEIVRAAEVTTAEIIYFYDPALTPEEEAAFKQYQKVDPATGQVYYSAPPLDPKEIGAVTVQLQSDPAAMQAQAQYEINNQDATILQLRAATGIGIEVPAAAVASEPQDIVFFDDPKPLFDEAPEPLAIQTIGNEPLSANIDQDELSALVVPIDITDDPAYPLPMGDEAIDKEYPDGILDPNLTPAQVASLSPGSQKLRAEELGYEYTGPEVTPGVIDPVTGDIVVTAEADGKANTQATAQDQANYIGYKDWRVRLALGPSSRYLYNAPDPGILAPLSKEGGTNGVIFPYTPGIQVSYAANYSPVDLTHSNYKVFQYTNSSVDSVTITADFTAQDVKEANYLLAVIHFFKSVTKMFYGQDASPKAGTPPPLCYIYGMGTYQFSGQPLAVAGFTYNLPSEVDYIKTTTETVAGVATANDLGYCPADISDYRLGSDISAGGNLPPPKFRSLANTIVTYIPTKIQLVISCVPIMSRNQVSNNFSLEQYSSGKLSDGARGKGGFW